MRILMLGWEFPPFISGGLGTACYGLTRALSRAGHEIIFVLPRPVDAGHASHVTILSPDEAPAPEAGPAVRPRADAAEPPALQSGETAAPSGFQVEGFERVTFHAIPANIHSVYTGARPTGAGPRAGSSAGPDPAVLKALRLRDSESRALRSADVAVSEESPSDAGDRTAAAPPAHFAQHPAPADGYEGDMLTEAERYARLVVRLARTQSFDVIHAHDWMTYPAALAVARASGKPLVAHIHSTEFDRSGESVNQRIYDIERRGMHAASRVVAVSQLTRSIVTSRYNLDPARVDVVYNGVESEAAQPRPNARIERKDKIVLFLGRITMQKGPEYFIAAAKRVLEKMDDVKFIVAGAGDLAARMIEQAAEAGIGHKVLFTGFLRGDDVKRVFQMADCYVMPSVSEPFGIAPLEAMSQDTPVIISRQSGVSEVLQHALRVDFWNVDEIADKIIAVLRRPPLSQTLREHGAFEVRRLTWDDAAAGCAAVYEAAAAEMKQPALA